MFRPIGRGPMPPYWRYGGGAGEMFVQEEEFGLLSEYERLHVLSARARSWGQ